MDAQLVQVRLLQGLERVLIDGRCVKVDMVAFPELLLQQTYEVEYQPELLQRVPSGYPRPIGPNQSRLVEHVLGGFDRQLVRENHRLPSLGLGKGAIVAAAATLASDQQNHLRPPSATLASVREGAGIGRASLHGLGPHALYQHDAAYQPF